MNILQKNRIRHKENDICIIGLGRLGLAAAKQLLSLNKTVLAIDCIQSKLDLFNDEKMNTICFDASNKDSLKTAGVDLYQTVIVAIGKDIQASLIIASILVEMKIPNLYVRASERQHGRILKTMGVKSIIYPEKDEGIKVALRSVFRVPFDFTIVTKQHSIFGISITSPKIIGKRIVDLKINTLFSCNVLWIKREHQLLFPKGSLVLEIDDRIFFAAANKDIKKISEFFSISA